VGFEGDLETRQDGFLSLLWIAEFSLDSFRNHHVEIAPHRIQFSCLLLGDFDASRGDRHADHGIPAQPLFGKGGHVVQIVTDAVATPGDVGNQLEQLDSGLFEFVVDYVLPDLFVGDRSLFPENANRRKEARGSVGDGFHAPDLGKKFVGVVVGDLFFLRCSLD